MSLPLDHDHGTPCGAPAHQARVKAGMYRPRTPYCCSLLIHRHMTTATASICLQPQKNPLSDARCTPIDCAGGVWKPKMESVRLVACLKLAKSGNAGRPAAAAGAVAGSPHDRHCCWNGRSLHHAHCLLCLKWSFTSVAALSN